MATLDDALQLATELRNELGGIDPKGLAPEQRGLVIDARDWATAAHSRIETAIAIDDQLHPEER